MGSHMRRLAPLLAVVIALGLGGCSLLGPDSEELSFQTLVRSDTLVIGTRGPSSVRAVVLQSEADEDRFATEFELAGPFPDVDYATSSVVGVVYGATAGGGVVLVGSAALQGDRVSLCTSYDGPPLVRADEPAAAFPVHLVVTPRVEREVTGMKMGPVGGSLGADC